MGGVGRVGDKHLALGAMGEGGDEINDDFEDSDSESPRPQGVADTVWKVIAQINSGNSENAFFMLYWFQNQVGCYKINPSTPSGRFYSKHPGRKSRSCIVHIQQSDYWQHEHV